MKHYIDFHEDVSIAELDALLDTAIDLKAKTKQGIPHPILAGKTLGMIFTKSSTRTRVSFEVGMYQLGGHALFLSGNDIQIGRGETIYDTAHVLSGMLDGIMIRTFAHQDIVDLAKYGSIPVINGLSDDQHPTQVLADLLTINCEKGGFEDLTIGLCGDLKFGRTVHSLIDASGKVDDLGILTAQLDGNIGLRGIESQGSCHCNDLLGERYMEMVGQSQTTAAGDHRMQFHITDQTASLCDQFGQSLLYMCEVSLVV